MSICNSVGGVAENAFTPTAYTLFPTKFAPECRAGVRMLQVFSFIDAVPRVRDLTGFRVELDVFRGPMDLLLHLVRKHELDVQELPLAKIAEQFLLSLDALAALNVDDVGDFLELASILVEFKSRSVLPQDESDINESSVDPREDLVQRLLLYKQFKDAALSLDDRFREWQHHFVRAADDAPRRKIELSDQPIKEVELWDLVSAFGRLLRDSVPPQAENIFYDETPLQVHMARIHDMLTSRGKVAFSDLFEVGMHKSSMIGVFLAILEMVRHYGAVTEQTDLNGEIWIRPGPGYKSDLVVAEVDQYNGQRPAPPGDPASLVQ
jgi:segregation and condensation protein A